MRYLRMRDWLMEAFYPPKPQVVQGRHEEVIGNRVVEVFTVNQEVGNGTPTMPFSSLNTNKKL
jgi:hypothetical protein